MSYASLFDRLPELKVGDRFTIDVYGERLVYEVDKVSVVLPDELDHLRPDPGQDRVTLVTCTPRLVNTHRLLVRGVRVPDAAEADSARLPAATATPRPHLAVQAWMLPRLSIAALAALLLMVILVTWGQQAMRSRRTSRS